MVFKKGKANFMYGKNVDNIGVKNPRYIDGRSLIKKYCLDCGKPISDYRRTRCQSCAIKYYWKLHKHPCIGKIVSKKTRKAIGKANFKQGLPKCIDCGKQLKDYRNKRCRSCSSKQLHIKGLCNYGRRPNKPEKFLNKILSKVCPKQYKYVGNGRFTVEVFNPDFINCNGQKKIIEMYGDYWHNTKSGIKRNKRRLKTYKKYGYKTLIVWEHELKNSDKLINKLKDFNCE